MARDSRKQEALEYHAKGRPGKIEVVPSKDAKTQRDLSLAYSPGVAEPCKVIADNEDEVYKYTAKGNLVGVISNGTAVLGLGNIGPTASKPVMEGKGVLFKIFADIDVFDIEINETDPDKFVEIVKALEPTFGGINLEDIKAPECFKIEQALKAQCNIPVMHDDQHGTAIISAAALLNALEIQKKKIDKVHFVINGAGAAAMACIRLYESLGARPDHFTLFDKDGVLHKGRKDVEDFKQKFCVNEKFKDLNLAKAIGRSDYPNQVNNVLGFPYIFRGALDVRAKQINEAMKLAAVKALAEIAKSPVPDIVNLAYNEKTIAFGPTYIIPKPFDPRLLATVAPAVAKAAMESGVARIQITDFDAYAIELNKRLGLDNQLSRILSNKAKSNPKRIVFADAENAKILKAAQMVVEEGIGYPILLGNEKKIREIADANSIDLDDMPIINPQDDEHEEIRKEFGEVFFQKRNRKGVNHYEAIKAMRDRTHFGCMMLETGEADCLISGLSKNYPETIRPALQIIGTDTGVKKIAGMYLLFTKRGPIFLADTTVNFTPTAEELAEITMLVAKEVRQFNITPRVAMLSYSNFGSNNAPEAVMVRKAREIIKTMSPNLVCDGELQGILAFNKELLKENYPFTELVNGDVNVLIFPNLAAGNIAHNLLQEIGGADSIGPILLGLKKPVHVLQLGSSVRSIYNMVVIAVVDAQAKSKANVQEVVKKSRWWKRKPKD